MAQVATDVAVVMLVEAELLAGLTDALAYHLWAAGAATRTRCHQVNKARRAARDQLPAVPALNH